MIKDMSYMRQYIADAVKDAVDSGLFDNYYNFTEDEWKKITSEALQEAQYAYKQVQE